MGVICKMVQCNGRGCVNSASKLRCPTCLKKGLPDAYYFSQKCFKDNWGIHKLVHIAEPSTRRDIPEHFRGYHFSGPLRPGNVSRMRDVLPTVVIPDYAENGIPVSERRAKGEGGKIHVHTAEEIEGVRTVCRMARQVLDMAGGMVAVGVTTEEIDAAVHQMCMDMNAYPSPLNYNYFPKSCCTSINEVICHGIPDDRPLEDGDIVNIDITLYYGGYHGDLNATYFVGNVEEQYRKLVRVTRECLDKAIAACKPGMLYRDVGAIITNHAHGNGFSVVRSYCGHGIGELFHTTPNVPHYAKNKAIGMMKPGHVFTIEPMINMGSWHDSLWPDNWTAVTKDGKRSAQFEETLVITETGVEVLTGQQE